MKKRILSLVLAIAMCFSVISVFASDNEAELMGEIGDLVNTYKDRVWSWQTNQFATMNEDQVAVIDAAWDSYEAKKDEVKAVAEELAVELVTDEVLSGDSMSDLYKWKLMRDIMEGRVDITSDAESYQDWLARFTEFEMANDEAVSPSAPVAALNGLGDYSNTLTEYFQELVEMVEDGDVVLAGEDADKAMLYIKAALAEVGLAELDEAEEAAFKEALENDVIELASEGMSNAFDLGMQVAANKINEGNTTGLFEEIPDRDMKAAFLILGEEFTRYLVDTIPAMDDKLLAMNKEELISAVAGDATGIMSGDNAVSVEALYDTMINVAQYVAAQPLSEELNEEVAAKYDLATADIIASVVNKLEQAMGVIDENHGLELMHFNTYLGRELLRYDNEGEWTKLRGAVIDGEAVAEIVLGFAHDKYPSIEKVNTLPVSLAQFDANYDADGIVVNSGGDEGEIGKLYVEISEDADGEAAVAVYRGYSYDEYAEDVYRYLATFTVTATGPVEEPDTITLDDIADLKLSEQPTITIKGTTTLDNVVVTVKKDGADKSAYVLVHTKAEFEEGITIAVPDGAQVGDVFTVAVGQTGTEATDTFEILPEDAVVEVTLEDIADFKLSEQSTITIKGTTTLENVVVSVALDGEEKYVVVHTKAEFEAGIVLNVPVGAKAGDVFTVAVGQTGAEAVDTFTILGEGEITLEDIADFKLSEQSTITIKGTTTLENIVVSVALDGEEKYVVVHTKAEFEEGIVLNVPVGAKAGDVFTVAVGQTGTEAVDTFTILHEGEITLEDIADFKLSEQSTITIKGTTTLENIVVTVKKNGEDKSVYVVVHTKAEFEEGIVLNVPDGAQAGDVYTVAVGQTGVEATDTFEILSEDEVTPSGTLSLTGGTTRTASVGGTVVITTTPQNIVPEGAEVVVVWTTEDGGVIEVTALAGEYNNIATITKLTKGTEKVTATLYVNGVAVDSKVITIKNKSTGGGGGTVYTSVTVKVDETKEVVKVPTGGVNVEFIGTGDGEVEVSIVDGVVVVTGIKEGTVKGEIKVTNENGKVVLTGDYKFVVEGAEVVSKHECEWPDIAATATKGAHWAHETIDLMTINGYINGYEDGTFKPDQNITRAEFSAIVYRILGLEEAEDGVLYDDTVGHWAEDIIATMSLPEGYGMLRGYGDGNFGPNDNITREQAVAIIARAKSAVWAEAEEGAKDIFTDAEDISWWFDGEMDAAVANGLITGYEDGSYKPLNFTTRAEACVLLARAWPEILE